MNHERYGVEIQCSKDYDTFYANDQDQKFEENFLKVVTKNNQEMIVVSCYEEGDYCVSYMTIVQAKALIDFLQKYVDKKSGDGKTCPNQDS